MQVDVPTVSPVPYGLAHTALSPPSPPGTRSALAQHVPKSSSPPGQKHDFALNFLATNVTKNARSSSGQIVGASLGTSFNTFVHLPFLSQVSWSLLALWVPLISSNSVSPCSCSMHTSFPRMPQVGFRFCRSESHVPSLLPSGMSTVPNAVHEVSGQSSPGVHPFTMFPPKPLMVFSQISLPVQYDVQYLTPVVVVLHEVQVWLLSVLLVVQMTAHADPVVATNMA